MANLTPEQAIRTLTKTEVKVLYLKCAGLKYIEMGYKYLHLGEDMVQKHMSNVYEKLGFDTSMHWTKRVKILNEVFCPALTHMISSYEELENWPPDIEPVTARSMVLAVVKTDEMREEEEKIKALQQVKPISIV